jgi:hypothetical protein
MVTMPGAPFKPSVGLSGGSTVGPTINEGAPSFAFSAKGGMYNSRFRSVYLQSPRRPTVNLSGILSDETLVFRFSMIAIQLRFFSAMG